MSRKKRYPPRFPRYAAGIRTQLRAAGAATRSWWWREWMAAMEKMRTDFRLEKGIKYAASGQVTEISAMGPHLDARVLGTRAAAYSVTLDFRVPGPAAKARILAAIRAEPIHVARILAGDLPIEVERIFRAESFDLFPGGKLGEGKYDMTCKCNCPDWANPCKHVFAVLAVLGEEVARRPMALLELRGITEAELYAD